MQMKNRKKHLSKILCMVLIVAMAQSITGCKDKNKTEVSSSNQVQETVQQEPTVLGEGKTVCSVTVVDRDGKETPFEIHTDKEMVAVALQELGLIDGEEGPYGLYIKTVNGITADYDTDGVYWAFYVNGEYAQAGADQTKIVSGDTYSFKVE